MKTTLPVKTDPRNLLLEQAEQALLDKLPIDQKTLRRVIRVLTPKNLAIFGTAIVGGSALFSIAVNIGKDRVYKAMLSGELKKQLQPLQKKLDDLEAQNAALWDQNQKLIQMLKQQNQN